MERVIPADAYAQKVADGYRPSRPDKMDPELFDLIEWCWRHDPNDRPEMKDVIDCLHVIQNNMEAAAQSGGGQEAGCGCIIS